MRRRLSFFGAFECGGEFNREVTEVTDTKTTIKPSVLRVEIALNFNADARALRPSPN
jgi:hypothetical protein